MKGVKGANKPSKAARRLCKGCNKYFGEDGMSASKNYCHAENKALDNIRYASKHQGKLDLYNRMKNDESKVVKVLLAYNLKFLDQVDAGAGKGKKTPAGVTFHMLEAVIVSTKVVKET